MKAKTNKFVLRSPRDADALWGVLKCWSGQAEAGQPLEVNVGVYEPMRNLDQNALMWVILTAFSEQLEWPVNGAMAKLSKEDWKDILTASFKSELVRLSQTTDGRIVMLGARTSRFTKAQFIEFIEFLHAVAAERGVNLSDMDMDEAA